MISLKKLLDTTSDEGALTLQAIVLFLNATAQRAVDYDSAKHAAYQRGMRDICERIKRTSEAASLLLLADEAAKLTDEYNRGLEEHLRSLSSEKQSALGLMIEGFIKICADSEAAAQNLRFIEQELGKASRLQDIRSLKNQMAGCLEALSHESARQEKGAEGLQRQIGLHNPGGVIYDPATGLPGALPAESYIRGCASSGQHIYVLLVVLKSLDVVNRRYGYTAGDHLISRYGAAIASRLPEAGRLFRWHGPSFIAVLPMPESDSAVNAEAARITAAPSEYLIEQDDRSILLKTTATWMALPILRSADAIDFSRTLDAFVTDHAGRPELQVSSD
ncbi:MAG TPA: GGDEF domain-containing protein [Bryobacteraceae bacterium]|nr:GGDEF domain-containing protein [Bryobacteraceae bacterium]